jgi:hypothetical protein
MMALQRCSGGSKGWAFGPRPAPARLENENVSLMIQEEKGRRRE